MASLNDCIYAMYVVMIIAWNNVHLFQQQSGKLYLCCTFGLLAWTLLSNISQLGLLLTHKLYERLSTYQYFLDVVLFQSTTKRPFFALHSSTLLLFSCPSSCWPKKTKDFKLHFLCALCEHCKSEALQRLAKKLHFTTQLGKMPLKPLQSTQETSPLPTVPQELPGGLADHLGMSLYKSDSLAFLYCTHMTAFPIITGLLCFLWTASSRNINATSVFSEKEKRHRHILIGYIYIYIHICMHTHT